jgi:hypothetical protein
MVYKKNQSRSYLNHIVIVTFRNFTNAPKIWHLFSKKHKILFFQIILYFVASFSRKYRITLQFLTCKWWFILTLFGHPWAICHGHLTALHSIHLPPHPCPKRERIIQAIKLSRSDTTPRQTNLQVDTNCTSLETVRRSPSVSLFRGKYIVRDSNGVILLQ